MKTIMMTMMMSTNIEHQKTLLANTYYIIIRTSFELTVLDIPQNYYCSIKCIIKYLHKRGLMGCISYHSFNHVALNVYERKYLVHYLSRKFLHENPQK